jgi:hypothetical protein
MRVRLRITPDTAIDGLIASVLTGSVCWLLGLQDVAAGVVLVGTLAAAALYVWVGVVLEPLDGEERTLERPAQMERCAACSALRPIADLSAGGFCKGGCSDKVAA